MGEGRNMALRASVLMSAVLALCIMAAGSDAAVYRYRDPSTGRMIISDTPPPGTAPADDAEHERAPAAATPPPTPSGQPAATPQPPPQEEGNFLVFVESTNYREGDYHTIQGVVRNTSPTKTMAFIKITVRLYDSRGTFIGVEETYVHPLHLAPGQEGTYTMMFRPRTELHTFRTGATWRWR